MSAQCISTSFRLTSDVVWQRLYCCYRRRRYCRYGLSFLRALCHTTHIQLKLFLIVCVCMTLKNTFTAAAVIVFRDEEMFLA